MPANFEYESLSSRYTQSLLELKDKDKVLRESCINAIALISFRIQQGGELGPYKSDWYKTKREKKGLQTEKVDLTLTNQMMSNFKVIDVSDGYGLGFDNQFAAEKANWNEERYGNVFVPNSQEQEVILESIFERVVKILNS